MADLFLKPIITQIYRYSANEQWLIMNHNVESFETLCDGTPLVLYRIRTTQIVKSEKVENE